MNIDATLAERLGLTEVPDLQPVPLPGSATAQGLAISEEWVKASALLESASAPDAGWVPINGLPAKLRAEHATNTPGLFLLETTAQLTAVGDCELLDGAVALDARGTRSGAVVVFSGDASVLLVAEKGALAAVALGSQALSRLPEPPVEPWLRRDLPQWLQAHVRTLASSPSALKRAQSIGALVRLWTTPAAGLSLASLLQRPDPTAAAKEWYRSVGGRYHRDILRHALDEAGVLQEELDDFPERLGEQDGATNRRMALSWLHRRDDLASLLVLSQVCELDEQPLREALAHLDRQGRSHLSVWSLINTSGDPHLNTVAWQDPEAWWGAR